MERSFSVYLDLVRFVAACLVYLYHSNMRLLVTDPLPASQLGHSSVIVFFVLSGFVIAYVADTKERDWCSFAASRISRIYSVALPALVLTCALDSVGRQLYPALYDYPFDHVMLRLVASFLMLNEVWFVSITSLSNVPYWSVAYESWYYLLFGLVTFLPRHVGWKVAAVALLLLGPKILLLLPVWLAGVGLYHWQWPRRISVGMGVAWLLISLIAIPLFHVIGVFSALHGWTAEQLGPHWFRQLTFSRYALGDYLLCALVFLNFAGMRRIAAKLDPLMLRVERPVRFLAGYTLTLYLLHQPLFLFWGAVIRGDPDGLGYWLALTLATALSVGLIGQFTEQKRHGLKTAVHTRLTLVSQAWRQRKAASS